MREELFESLLSSGGGWSLPTGVFDDGHVSAAGTEDDVLDDDDDDDEDDEDEDEDEETDEDVDEDEDDEDDEDEDEEVEEV